MKTIFLSAILVLATLTARAGNEGPHAAPLPPQAPQMPLPPHAPPVPVIAEVTSGNGFAAPGSPYIETLSIDLEGVVKSTKHYRIRGVESETVEDIARLSFSASDKLNKLISQVTPGELVLENPNMPRPSDASVTTYSVRSVNTGTMIAISSYEAYLKRTKTGSTYVEKEIETILKGLAEFAN